MEAKQIHIYHAIAMENQLDNQFFIVPLFGQDIFVFAVREYPHFGKPTTSSWKLSVLSIVPLIVTTFS